MSLSGIQTFNRSCKFGLLGGEHNFMTRILYFHPVIIRIGIGNYISFPYFTKPFIFMSIMPLPESSNFLLKTIVWSLLTWKSSLQTTKHYISCLFSWRFWQSEFLCSVSYYILRESLCIKYHSNTSHKQIQCHITHQRKQGKPLVANKWVFEYFEIFIRLSDFGE